MSAGSADVAAELRQLLADLTRDPAALHAPPDTPLLRDGLGLDSLGGTVLLTEIKRRYGIDIADDDLNLDSLANIGTLAAYVSARAPGAGLQARGPRGRDGGSGGSSPLGLAQR